MISREMLELLFRPASMQRWNDHIRPHTGFSELDKQAHKMVFAYVLARSEETDRDRRIEWRKLIEAGIFEFLQRGVLTDLKPEIYHRLMDEKSEDLNSWVAAQLQTCIEGIEGGFQAKFSNYFQKSTYAQNEKRILKAAHYLATNWEFDIIQHLNQGFFGLEQTKQNIGNEVEEFYDLAGVQKYLLGKKTHNFMDLVGQMRFQQRWAQTPRVPETSVLGHMLIVAIITYLFSVEMGACEKRIYNNFFAALFHDLPEVLTRDIISPVKRSVAGIEAIIKDVEKVQLEERIMPLLPRQWQPELRYFLDDEFKSKVMHEGSIIVVDSERINREFDSEDYNPIDGELVKACDGLAAYIEASMSINYGMRAPDLVRGKGSIYQRYAGSRAGSIDFQPYFDYFQEVDEEPMRKSGRRLADRLSVVRGDITAQQVEAIVNAANYYLLGGGGVDGAIHLAAGAELMAEYRQLGGCQTGEALMTRGYNLPAPSVIHTVGPIWRGGISNEEQVLADCYRNVLNLAVEKRIKSLAFPPISTGVYGFPPERAARIAVREISEFLHKDKSMDKILLVTGDEELYNLYQEALEEVQMEAAEL